MATDHASTSCSAVSKDAIDPKAVPRFCSSSAQANLKARILLKADQGEAGEGWLDERICDALDTNATMASRRQPKDTWAVNVVSVGSVWQWPAVRGVANRFPPEFFSVP